MINQVFNYLKIHFLYKFFIIVGVFNGVQASNLDSIYNSFYENVTCSKGFDPCTLENFASRCHEIEPVALQTHMFSLHQTVLKKHEKLEKNYNVISSDSLESSLETLFSYEISSAYLPSGYNGIFYRFQAIDGMNIKSDAKIFYKKVALFTNVYLLFREQQKNMPQDVLDRYAAYYQVADKSIPTDAWKPVVDQLLQSNLFDNHKLFLAGLVFMRGLWKDSEKIICAKDPDGDCGNYVLNLTYSHKEEKYGAMKIQNLLKKPCVQEFLNKVDINTLYPVLAQSVLLADSISDKRKSNSQPVENKEIVSLQSQSRLATFLKFVFFPVLLIYKFILFCKSKIIDNHKKESNNLVDAQKNQSSNQEQVADLVDSYKG